MRDKSYSELVEIPDFIGRFRYLALHGSVGEATFAYDRWMNQLFYSSREWKQVRTEVIARDLGCDLGLEGFDIHAGLYIHHMNPMTPDDIKHGNEDILDPEFLITTCHQTHNAIHYGDERQLPRPFVERRPGDHILWKRD